MSDKSKTSNHVHEVEFDTDGNPTTGTVGRPHPIAYPPEGIKPMPAKGTTALTQSGYLNTRFIELYKDKTVLPVYRFTTDILPRLRDRESTPSGVVTGEGIFLENAVGGDDFILMETDVSRSDVILSE